MAYSCYYNQTRTRLSLDKDTPWAELSRWDFVGPGKLYGARITASAMQVLTGFIWNSAMRVAA